MNVKECLEFLAANGVALAEYIFSVSQKPRAKVELSALFGIDPTTMADTSKLQKLCLAPRETMLCEKKPWLLLDKEI